ncbi:Scr1 family TA system antitoxin-like transcriptional regulator [Nocardiopsis sp. RSe5-2]|uniref:Scr1 family TA system antitoxin-like transcriptional regulator n=1 Tax=Nocardiopsis endophytica TaxID=3018445 RepID=A0ABT4U3Z0_9ACTN|nr:Scr1 family TA system antitoxin-like transcriptional regulator [Nocardiopsis endophytica]MDA2811189.1 Scr1 family TA system antitoxin-like transcriptional regulator [Nocardiopsis endophytica]
MKPTPDLPRSVDFATLWRQNTCRQEEKGRRSADEGGGADDPADGTRPVLDGIGDPVAQERSAHLGAEAMVPAGSILTGVTSPFQIYRLRDGSQVATSEHTNGTILVNEAPGVQRLQDLARTALGSALPADDTLRRLKEISDE